MINHQTETFIVKLDYWNLVIGHCLVIVSCILVICFLLAGCESMALKKSGLYLNKSTSVEMNDFGVAKMRNQF